MLKSYVSLDLETTGLNPRLDRIIEIGALKVENGEIVDTFCTFVNPGRRLEERIIDLTGIEDKDVEDAPYIEEVLPGLLMFLGDLPLLGHSVLFDFSFLKKESVDLRVPFERSAVDTLKIARKYLVELEHRSLDYLCEYYKIPHRAHRALEDARATHILYGKLAENFYEKECNEASQAQGKHNLFEPVPLQFQIKRDTPVTKAQKEQLYRLLEQHRIVLNADVERLTRSEASRFIDKIRSGQFAPSDAGE